MTQGARGATDKWLPWIMSVVGWAATMVWVVSAKDAKATIRLDTMEQTLSRLESTGTGISRDNKSQIDVLKNTCDSLKSQLTRIENKLDQMYAPRGGPNP